MYASVRSKMADLEEQEKLIKGEILEALEKEKKKTEESPYGRFTISVKKNYIYSGRIKKLEEELKVEKYHEQEQNLCSVRETKYLSFTPKHG